MKNKFLSLKQNERTPLCKLGLNVSYFRFKRKGFLYYDIEDVLSEVENIRALIVENNKKKTELIICNKAIKKETLFKNVYKYRNNFTEKYVYEMLSNEDNKSIILERLDLIITLLKMY